MCKGQSPSRGSGLLLFNKLNCCPPQLLSDKYKKFHSFVTVWAGKCYENEGKPMAKSAVDRGKSYNTTPENTARRKARVCLESAR